MTTRRKIDFDGRDWSAHAQDSWLEFAGNVNFPDYLRIVFVGYGRHGANGHAVLDRGELARYLIRKDGSIPDRRTLWHALDKAVGFGYLMPGSKQLCLVVPGHHVQGGRGDPSARCGRDHTTRRKHQRNRDDGGRYLPNDARDTRRSGTTDVRGAGHSGQKDATRGRRSTVSPSISLPTAPARTLALVTPSGALQAAEGGVA